MKSIKVILFDWDGTLIDSLSVKAQNAGRLFAQVWGLEPASVTRSYLKHSGIPRRQLFNAILADHGLPPLAEDRFTELSQQFSTLNLECLYDKKILSAKTREALQKLTEAGFRLYISSSAEAAEIEQIAEKIGIRQYFQEILGSKGEFTKGIPHVKYVLQQEDRKADEVTFVGDDLADMRLGNEAGIMTIGKSGTQPPSLLKAAGAQKTIDEIAELLDLLSN